jgi:DNA-binding NarL/FixJ family response regulator
MINIVIADHQAIFRAGIAKILAVEEDLRVVGQPNSCDQLMNCLEKLRCRVLILSRGFTPDLNGVQAAARTHNVATLMLIETPEDSSVYMASGVQGVVYRSVPGDSMVEAVRRLSRGEQYVQAGGTVAGTSTEDEVGVRVRDQLSDKEIKIMAAVVRGLKNRDIALQLYTSEQVIKNALKNIFDKTGVSDRLELALFVLHHHILAQAAASVQIQPEQRRVRRSQSENLPSSKPLPPRVY